MICMNCGKHVDDDVRVCPFCGSVIEAAAPAAGDPAPEEDPLPVIVASRKAAPEEEIRPTRSEPEYGDEDEPRGSGSFFNPAFILSLVSVILSVVCLVTLLSLRGSIQQLGKLSSDNTGALQSSVASIGDRLDRLDSTLANVQTQAYEQVASQSIAITKDITPLTGPVDEGKYNQMFIVKAKGNLNVDSSFDWQRYNEATGGWVSIIFTGEATTNEQFGLRLENQFNAAEKEYTTILWAQGITKEAAGTYRCVITDNGGITKTSAEAVVAIQEVE